MIFVQFWWALLAFNSPGYSLEAMDAEHKDGIQGQSVGVSEQLQSFSRAMEKAGPELQELWSSFGAMQELDSQKEQARERRNTLDDMLASFAQSPLEGSKAEAEKDIRAWQEEADAWYRDIQAKSGSSQKRTGGKQERSAIKEKAKDPIDKALQRPETSKTKQKYKEGSEDAIILKHEVTSSPAQPSHLDMKLKPMPQLLSEHENLETQSQVKALDVPKKIEGLAEKLPELRDTPAADGGYESTLNHLDFRQDKSNKLDHEANYKLSKIEQEASEKLPKYPRSGSLDKDNFKQQKRSSSVGFNPMDEIKLKTSCRMIAKGFGPLLPSETYDITRRRKLEDWQPLQFESRPGAAHGDRMNMKSFEPQNDNFEYNQYSKGSAVDADQMMDLPQNFDYQVPQYDRFYSLNQRERPNVLDYDRSNRMPIDLEGFKREPSLGTSSPAAQYKPGLGSSSIEAVREPAMKPPTLEAEIKSRLIRSPLEGEEDQKVPTHKMDTGLTDIKEVPSLSSIKEHESKEKEELMAGDLLAKAEAFFEPQASVIEGRVEDKLKNNAEVAAPATNLSPEGTGKLVANQDIGGGRFPRRTRRVKRSLEDYQQEQQEPHSVAKRKAQQLDDFEDHNGNRASFGVLGNGMLTPDAEDLRGKSMILPSHEMLVHYNELETSHDHDSLAHVCDPTKNLVPMMNQHQELQQQRSQSNQSPLQSSRFKANFNLSHPFNEMQELQESQSPQTNPVPIQHGGRRATYINDLILQKAEGQQKYFGERQNSLRVLGEVFRQDVALLDPSKINQKTRLVKELLRQYRGLPLGDQLAATDMLLLDLDYLRKMAGTAVRRQRNALLYEVLKQESLNETLEKQISSKHSSRFIKRLLETAELFKVWDSLTF